MWNVEWTTDVCKYQQHHTFLVWVLCDFGWWRWRRRRRTIVSRLMCAERVRTVHWSTNGVDGRLVNGKYVHKTICHLNSSLFFFRGITDFLRASEVAAHQKSCAAFVSCFSRFYTKPTTNDANCVASSARHRDETTSFHTWNWIHFFFATIAIRKMFSRRWLWYAKHQIETLHLLFRFETLTAICCTVKFLSTIYTCLSSVFHEFHCRRCRAIENEFIFLFLRHLQFIGKSIKINLMIITWVRVVAAHVRRQSLNFRLLLI